MQKCTIKQLEGWLILQAERICCIHTILEGKLNIQPMVYTLYIYTSVEEKEQGQQTTLLLFFFFFSCQSETCNKLWAYTSTHVIHFEKKIVHEPERISMNEVKTPHFDDPLVVIG